MSVVNLCYLCMYVCGLVDFSVRMSGAGANKNEGTNSGALARAKRALAEHHG